MNEPSVFGIAGIAWLVIGFMVWCESSGPPLPATRTERILLQAGKILVVVLPIVMMLSLPSELEQERADAALREQVWFTAEPPDHR